jgi:hypothetical protein
MARVGLTIGIKGGPAIAWRDEMAALLVKHQDNPRAELIAERVMSSLKMDALFVARYSQGCVVLWPSDYARSLLLEVRTW